MVNGSEPRKTSANEQEQPQNLRPKPSFCSFSLFYAFYKSQPVAAWVWVETLWPAPALFRAVAVVVLGFPTVAKGWAWLVVPATRSEPSGVLPKADSSPPTGDEPTPIDCGYKRPPA